MRSARGRKRWLALVLLGLPAAFAARTELNLAHDRSTDSAATAVILTESDVGWNSYGMRVWLHGVTDLSVPAEQQKQVLLSNLRGPQFGHFARVSPGRYTVDVECERRHGTHRSFPEELTVDAEAGKAYVIGCLPRTPKEKRPKAYVREGKGGVESQRQ